MNVDLVADVRRLHVPDFPDNRSRLRAPSTHTRLSATMEHAVLRFLINICLRALPAHPCRNRHYPGGRNERLRTPTSNDAASKTLQPRLLVTTSRISRNSILYSAPELDASATRAAPRCFLPCLLTFKRIRTQIEIRRGRQCRTVGTGIRLNSAT